VDWCINQHKGCHWSMTKEQEIELEKIGQTIRRLFPDMYGKVHFQFNVNPTRKEVNMNYGVEQSKILK
jgi:hypothetical protein